MDKGVLDKRFLHINKRLGLLVGVWPYQERRRKILMRTIVVTLMMSCYVTQFSRLFVYPGLNIILSDYPYLLVGIGTMLKLGNYIINESKLNVLMGGIYEDWRTMKSKDEHKIMTRFAERGVLVVILYLLHIAIGVTVFVCLPFAPPILDMIKPLNESRKPLYPYPGYYFVDLDKYHYPIITHMSTILILLSIVFCACDANYLYAVQHACGLLAVTGHGFKYACHYRVAGNNRNVMKLTRTMYRNVCHSIRRHQRALQYIKEIESAHDTCLFITVGMLMLSISIILLKISENERGTEWLANCIFFFAELLHMLFLTVQGQFVVNLSDNIYDDIFAGMWYNSRCETQALYILALRRSLNPPALTVGGFLPLNLKTFVEVVKASVSYYTVMQSK